MVHSHSSLCNLPEHLYQMPFALSLTTMSLQHNRTKWFDVCNSVCRHRRALRHLLHSINCSQECMAYHAIGNASSDEKAMSFRNSADNNPASPITPAPSTLRMPISFVLRSAVKAARPNNPRQEIHDGERPQIRAESLPRRLSLRKSWLTLAIYRQTDTGR